MINVKERSIKYSCRYKKFVHRYTVQKDINCDIKNICERKKEKGRVFIYNLSCYQLKTDLCLQDVLCKPEDKHKTKTYSRYIQHKKEGNQRTPLWKIINSRRKMTREERNKGTTKEPENN